MKITNILKRDERRNVQQAERNFYNTGYRLLNKPLIRNGERYDFFPGLNTSVLVQPIDTLEGIPLSVANLIIESNYKGKDLKFFPKVAGTLKINSCPNLISIDGLTNWEPGDIYRLDFSNLPNLTDAKTLSDRHLKGQLSELILENLPKLSLNTIQNCHVEGSLYIKNCKDTSLSGIQNSFPSVFRLYISEKFKTGFLSLLQIKNLQSVHLGGGVPKNPEIHDGLKIIRKYLPCGPNDKKKIMACQDELIDAGFEKMATL